MNRDQWLFTLTKVDQVWYISNMSDTTELILQKNRIYKSIGALSSQDSLKQLFMILNTHSVDES